ncbi:histidinol-phosphate transaminase [bacterium]|nr:histidinol-phosphate transaminase [bacterium]
MDLSKFVRPHLDALHPYVPGKPVREERNILKLASNENLLGPPVSVVKALQKAAERVHYYPDDGSVAVRMKLAEKFNLEPDMLLPVAGCAEGIYYITQAFVDEGDEVVVSHPGFSIFNIAGAIQNAKVVRVPVKDDFTPDTAGMGEAVTENTKIVWLDNPNNPCSTIVRRPQVEELVSKIGGRALFVHDEAYVDFVTDPSYASGLEYLQEHENVIVLRTFSKIYALAGLRIGAIIARPEIITALHKVRMPFNVNALAQAALLAALDDEEYHQHSVAMAVEMREQMGKLLDEYGFRYVPSHTNFLLFDARVDCVELAQEMNEHGVFVRPMKGAGLATWVRASVPSNVVDCYRFADTLAVCQQRLLERKGGGPAR